MAKPKVNSKFSILVLVLLGLAVLAVKTCKRCNSSTSTNTTTGTEKIDRREKDFRHHPLQYTEHARCRMECRHITETEVQQVVADGKINYRKTDKKATPCATYALEGYAAGKKLRIVVGDCKTDAVIITVIDLEHEFECHCPGDENKN